MADETPAQAFDRGAEAGRVSSVLNQHADHLAKINGSMDRVADELAGLRLAVQRLGDDAKANQATVVTTAAALKDADQARRARSDQSWSPLARIVAVVGLVTSVVGFYFLVRPR